MNQIGYFKAFQWFKNGDHPEDDSELVIPNPFSTTQFEPFLSEGKVVRYFEHPDEEGTGKDLCAFCHKIMHVHGEIKATKYGKKYTVCPGDWIITDCTGMHHVLSGQYIELKEGETNE